MKANDLINKYSLKSLDELKNEFNSFSGGFGVIPPKIKRVKRDSILKGLARAFINPYAVVLYFLAIITLVIDIIIPKNKSYTSFIIIAIMLLVSGIVRFIEELRAKKIADSLNSLSEIKVLTKRDGGITSLGMDELVFGDIVMLRAGDRAPADIRIIEANNLFVSAAMLTGESDILEKNATDSDNYKNIIYMGSTIISGEATGICIALGNDTVYGDYKLNSQKKKGFDRGANSIIWVLIKFMFIMIPLVFISAGIIKGSWLEAFLFSISVAVGLTPELLPMVITACLARGSSRMKDKSTIVKNINAMQAFGSMDVLCLDKTGTLTNDKLVLEYYMDILGNEDLRALDLAYLNSLNSSGVENHLDKAIVECEGMPSISEHLKSIAREYKKLDERPFDYTRRISSVLIKGYDKRILIAKGGIDEILARVKYIDYKGHIKEINTEDKRGSHLIVDEMLEDGMKVLAVAYRLIDFDSISSSSEEELVLAGYIAFFDSPKPLAKESLEGLMSLNLELKLLTGDNKKVSTSICRRLNMKFDSVLTGEEFDSLGEDYKRLAVENNNIFCELSPKNKEEIVSLLKDNGHTVGFMGDGMNDLKAILKSDVGISVDTSMKALRDASDVILLKKDLNVLEEGIIEGRRAFYNMSKYIKITTSSNLGNIIAIIIASVMLPFLPITSIQLLLLNLLYDIICLVLPWDRVNLEYLRKPLVWSGGTLSRFMLSFGPISSIFDIVSFLFLYFYLGPVMLGGGFNELGADKQLLFISIFQTGWFLESMWSQVLIIHMLRTKHMPVGRESPSRVVFGVTIIGVILLTILAVTPLGGFIGFTSLPVIYYVFLGLTVIGYLLLVSMVKYLYIKKYKDLI